MDWYEKIVEAHLAVTDRVSHNRRIKSSRYFVWQEEGAKDFEGDGRHLERAMRGSTDLFTKQERDPWSEKLEHEFDRLGIAWKLNSVQYEEDTGFTHYEWLWEAYSG